MFQCGSRDVCLLIFAVGVPRNGTRISAYPYVRIVRAVDPLFGSTLASISSVFRLRATAEQSDVLTVAALHTWFC